MDASLVFAAESALLMAIALIILFWLLPDLRLDCFRQEMFVIRDELFDYAASGNISFDHPAYRLLRQSMNGYIRYGHQITFYRSVMTSLSWKVALKERRFTWHSQWNEALKSLDEQQKTALRDFHLRASSLVVKRIVLGSPLLVLVLSLSVLLAVFHVGWKSINELVTVALSRTAEALLVDSKILDEEAAARAA